MVFEKAPQSSTWAMFSRFQQRSTWFQKIYKGVPAGSTCFSGGSKGSIKSHKAPSDFIDRIPQGSLGSERFFELV